MARNEQLIRQHKILQILERYRFGRLLEEIRDDLIDELGLSSLHTRTLRRDMEALQAAGLDVARHNTQRGPVWKLGPRFKGTHKISASATELIALSLGRDLMYPLAGTPFWLGIESFWNKMREELPEAVLKHYEKYRQTLYVRGMPAKSYEKHHGMLKTIHRAIIEHRVLEIDYEPVGRDARRRRVDPYAVVFFNSSLYIICATDSDSPEDRIRHLKLDRFRSATALDDWFKPDENFDLEKHLGESLGIFSGASGKARTFRVRISAYAANWVLEDPWRPDQQVERKKNGDLVLTIRAAHELEVIPRVLALGSEAELLSPKSCRRTIAQMVGQMAAQYDDE
ncbi:MAG: WYL domain-containing protein [Pirellulaceae bacterium]|jgi:predicted DNA-binding transcriptional regulator YafY|nr:WYL domain-containing protein [Pirellulaceae bacterium]